MSLDLVKQLRSETGLSLDVIKKAVKEGNNDFAAAKKWLRENQKAKFDGVKEAVEGCIGTYLHHNKQIGCLVYLGCQTDFTARNAGFQELANSIALHIASTNPRWVSKDSIPAEMLTQEREFLAGQTQKEGKPAHLVEKIVEGKLKAFYQENVLLEQVFVKGDQTISQMLTEFSAKTGEVIVIKSFSRQEVGR